jgi:CBS domain-containing protein
MIARELMKRRFPYVTRDADLDYVARVLSECGLGVVPVVDENLCPIGIVTRSNLDRARAPVSADLGDIPEFLLRSRPKAPLFRRGAPSLREVMTTPAISVPCTAPLPEVAKTMESHHLKRAPVVDGHKIVGLVLRKEIMQAIAGASASVRSATEALRCDLASAEEFRELVLAHERQLEAERAARRRGIEDLHERRIRQLAARRLTDSQWRDMIARARAAAAAGLTDHMLIRFPAQLCTDGGRAINAPDPRWTETLRGEPADVFRRWRNELQPRGFRLAAQIIDFPGGVPGDAALFLIWGAGAK